MSEHDRSGENAEIEYYKSLGYTEKQAKRIASLTFEPKRSRLEFPLMKSRVRGVFARAGGAAVMESAPCGMAADEVFHERPAPVPPSPVPIMAPVDIEDVRSDEYEHIEEIGAQSTLTSPTSTFRTTYNTAAATILLSHFRKGTRISRDMVRTEELLNFLPFDLKKPEGKRFEVTQELKKEGDRGFLFLGIRGSDAVPERKNVVLLVDTSGSMESKRFQIRAILATVFAELKENDVFSLVTYSDTDHTFLNGMKVGPKYGIDYVLDHLKDMTIDGCTYGSKGIETAYSIIEENYIEDGVNRVILVTDGDLNFGITDKGGLIDLISKKRETGAYLSCLGTGLYNLRDDKLEALAKNGNGNYFVLNDLADVKEVLYGRFHALIYPIAKNVKAQVEFNPSVVRAYRLIGYENRRLTHEQFRDDRVAAEPFGAGAYCTACYELFFTDPENVKPLKYQRAAESGKDELGTLTVRYQNVGDDKYEELEFVLGPEPGNGPNCDRAKACAEAADILRREESEGKKRRAVRSYLELLAGTAYADLLENGGVAED